MQKTIKKSVRCSGIGITGQMYSTITLQPAPPGSGIVFVREDLPDQPEIPCRAEYARVEARWTTLVREGVRVEHTEHLLAAIAGLGLDNLRIGMDSPYIPVVSGFSSGAFVEALTGAEPVFQDAPKEYAVIHEPLCLSASFNHNETRYDRILMALPAPGLTITYLLDYPDKELPTQVAHFSFDASLDFGSELATARSYIMESEYETVVKLIGKSMEECLVVTGEALNLQWNNEPARHKALDLLGDLCTMGQPLRGHFIGIRSGHRDNIQLCRKLKMQIKEELGR